MRSRASRRRHGLTWPGSRLRLGLMLHAAVARQASYLPMTTMISSCRGLSSRVKRDSPFALPRGHDALHLLALCRRRGDGKRQWLR
jgi:hypothetical protein